MAGLEAGRPSAPACDASLQRLGIETIDLYYQHQDNRDVPLADSLGAFERCARRARSARSASAISPPRGSRKRCDAAVQAGIEPRRSRCRTGTIWSSATSSRATLQDVVTGRGLAFFPYYSLANGFLTGKYRSKDDLGKSVRGAAQPGISRSAKGDARARRARRGRGRNRGQPGDGRARLDQGPARGHRADRQRDQPGAGRN